MERIKSFKELCQAPEGELPDGYIHRVLGEDLLQCEFVVTSSDEQKGPTVEVNGELVPTQVADLGMEPWIDSQTFEDVVLSREDKTGKRDVADIAKAVVYYLENDDFMD